MDPVSAVGLVGSLIGVADIAGRSINKLSVLRVRYRQANFFVSALLGQLCTIKAALTQLAEFQRSDAVDQLQTCGDLAHALETSNDGCAVLIGSLEEQLDQMNPKNQNQLDVKGKLSFLWNDVEIKEYLNLLNNQVNALNLLLQAIQCKSQSERMALMQEEDSITVMRLARECTDSLHVLEDDRSSLDGMSISSETTARLSARFDFDKLLLGSRVYQAASELNVRKLIKSEATLQRQLQHVPEPSSPPTRAMNPYELSNKQQTQSPQDKVGSFVQPTPALLSPAGARRKNSTNSKPMLASSRWLDGNTVPTLGENTISKRTEIEVEYETASYSSDSLAAASSDMLNQALSIDTEANRIDLGLDFEEVSGQAASSPKAFPGALRKGMRKLYTYVKLQLDRKRIQHQSDTKVLLLGASESGKTTLFKSMKLHYEGSYAKHDRQMFKEIILDLVTENLPLIFEVLRIFHNPIEQRDRATDLHRRFLASSELPYALTNDVVSTIKYYWVNGESKKFRLLKREHGLPDYCSYFCESIERIAGPDYVPTDADILNASVKTSGTTEATFTSTTRTTWWVHDVGGARSERKKWIYCYANTECMIFTVDITGIHKLRHEDEKGSSMQQSLALFDSIINSTWFERTACILLFTNSTKLPQLLEDMPIRTYFPDFTGKNRMTDVVPFITQKFIRLKRNPQVVLEVRYADINNGNDSMAKIAEQACTSAMRRRESLISMDKTLKPGLPGGPALHVLSNEVTPKNIQESIGVWF